MMIISKKKYAIFSTMLALTAAPQFALAQSAPLSGLYACEAISGQADQLACFRAETAKLRAAETSGDVIAVEKDTLDEIKKTEVRKAEVKREKAVKEKSAKTRTLAIRSTATYGSKGYVRFTLENGEVWRQTEAARIRFTDSGTDTLTLKRAAMGSHRGTVNGKRPSFRVRQVK